MKLQKIYKKYLSLALKVAVFLFVTATFIYSFYKIATITRLIEPFAFGFSCDDCWEWCEEYNDWCSNCWDWCDDCWPSPSPCFEPSPSPEPSPTEEPSPSPVPSLEPSPSPKLSPLPVGGNGGTTTTTSTEATAKAWECGKPAPDAPTLLSVDFVQIDPEVKLVWSGVEPSSHYAISYGLEPGKYIYGVPNTGKTTNYIIGGLEQGRDYCFAVRAVNECAPSELSNELCTGGTGGGQVLGVSTLGETGSNNLFYLTFTIGAICLSLGIKMYLPKKKPAYAC